jgi:hypothetical protein
MVLEETEEMTALGEAALLSRGLIGPGLVVPPPVLPPVLPPGVVVPPPPVVVPLLVTEKETDLLDPAVPEALPLE